MTKKKFFKSVITITVLTETPAKPTLFGIGEAILAGRWVGDVKVDELTEINAKQMADAVLTLNGDLEKFELDVDGDEIEFIEE